LSKSEDQELQPNTKTFSAVINAYAKSFDKGSASKAGQLLAETEQRSDKEIHLKPNTITYSTVINALAKSGEVDGPDRAEAILRNMMERFRSGEVTLNQARTHLTALLMLGLIAVINVAHQEPNKL